MLWRLTTQIYKREEKKYGLRRKDFEKELRI